MKLSDALLWAEEQETNEIVSKEEETNDDVPLCMITKQPIQHKMTLKCGHSFEYSALYQNYIQNQKKFKYHYCPYCRQWFPLFIPFNELALPFTPKSYTMFSNKYLTCQYVYKSGIKKGCVCTRSAHIFKNGTFCTQHRNRKEPKKKRDVTVNLCKQTLKNGKPCTCKVCDEESGLCKRHYNLKNKE
jgi:hypothetical protein